MKEITEEDKPIIYGTCCIACKQFIPLTNTICPSCGLRVQDEPNFLFEKWQELQNLLEQSEKKMMRLKISIICLAIGSFSFGIGVCLFVKFVTYTR